MTIKLTIDGNTLRANPQILEARKIERWNGVLTNVVGGNDVMFNLGESK